MPCVSMKVRPQSRRRAFSRTRVGPGRVERAAARAAGDASGARLRAEPGHRSWKAQPAPPHATGALEAALPDGVVDDDVREVAAEVVDAEARLRGDDVDDGQEARAPRPVERVFGRGERGRDVRRRRAVALRQDDAVRHLRGTRIFDPTSMRA